MTEAWRIWYADGSTYSSYDGEGYPDVVPGYGVQAIAQPDPTEGVGNVGYLVLTGYDWYYWHVEYEEWAGATGDPSIWDLILHREPIVGICQGRRINRALYHAILEDATTWAREAGLPRKSGFHGLERA